MNIVNIMIAVAIIKMLEWINFSNDYILEQTFDISL